MSSAPPPPPPSGPPPGDAPYGSSQPASPRWDLGQCVSYAWSKFQANAGQLILAGLALALVIVVVEVIAFFVTNAMTDFRTGFLVQMLLNAVAGFVVFFVAQVVAAGLIRGALGITEGRDFELAEVFRTDKIVPVVITSLIISALAFVGFLLCYLPGIVVTFATSYALYFVVDQGLEPVEAIKASVNLVKDNLADTLIWYIVGGLIAAAGALVCIVGLLVTLPLALIGTAFTYKRLTGQPVAA